MANTSTPERRGGSAPPGASYALGQAVFNRPLAMEPEAASWLARAIQDRDFDAPLLIGGEASQYIGVRDSEKACRVTEDGIAIVPIAGALLDRGGWLGGSWWGVSYETLTEQMRLLGKDSGVKAVLLDINSGGGMVAGLWECCEAVIGLDKRKPVYALAQNAAYSAAYALGCSARELHVTSAGGVGSIGVVMIHASMARLYESAGIDVTLITAGEHKTDGSPFRALGHGARSEMSEAVDEAYDDFAAHVAKRRTGLDAEAVRATEARLYAGARAVSARLADSVKSIDEMLAHIRAELKGGAKSAARTAAPPAPEKRERSAPAAPPPQSKPKGRVMENDRQPLEAAQTSAAPAATQPDAAAAARQAGAAERQRIQAITKAGADAPRLAAHLAFETGLDAATAEGILAAAAQDLAVGRPEASEPAEGRQETQRRAAGDALSREMAKPENSARVAPTAVGAEAGALPSLAEKAKDFGRPASIPTRGHR